MVRANDALSLSSTELRALQRTNIASQGGVATTRNHNLALVLSLLNKHGAMTRPQLVRRSGLSAPTVSALVAELVDAGTVTDLGVFAEAKVGKPASRVEINATGNACAIIDLTPDHEFVATLLNLAGDVIATHRVDVGDAQGENALRFALDLARTALAASPIQTLGIGVASPGLVDDQGQILVADRLGWRDLPMAELMEQEFSVPTYVGNDVNLMALGLRRFHAPSARDLVAVTIENGIGAAVVIDGTLVEGEQFAAGEIGHVWVGGDDGVCECGRTGCLDRIANARYLGLRIHDLSPEAADAELWRAGDAVGAFLTPVLSVLNITDVALVGPAELLEGPFEHAALAAIRSRNRPAVAAGISLHVHSDSSRLVALGAMSAVLEAGLGVR